MSLPRRHSKCDRSKLRAARALAAASSVIVAAMSSSSHAEDVSAPATLQWFDGSWKTMQLRTGDIFQAGYGGLWTPPAGRADSGNQSVGYDLFDRFDLGSPGNPTLYGTETGMKMLTGTMRRAGMNVYADAILNHNGFKDQNTTNFAKAGGYPGFFLSYPGDANGDFHAANATGDTNMRISGLIDIDQAKNYLAIRNPVPGYANNLPAGTQSLNGRIANVPTDANRRFYPDQSGTSLTITDGGQQYTRYDFNNANPSAGDPIAENNLDYLARYTQWMIQVVGVDGFRFDAAKHLNSNVLPTVDRAIYRASSRTMLDGSPFNPFSFSEVYDGSKALQQSNIRKTINPATPNVVGGNRDVLDFPQFFALRDNLQNSGVSNNWNNVVSAGMDVNDDGKHNGSQGVLFVGSHDDGGAEMSGVAHAYTLMQPGNAIVYFNGREFGTNRDFPGPGRDDALGGFYGDKITNLVEIRSSHGRGNWKQRFISKELFAFERQNSALVLLNNRGDTGFDAQNVPTGFAAGTTLVELTGNANDLALNPNGDIPQTLTVKADGSVDARFLRNKGADGTVHGNGYLIYGLAGPQGAISVAGLSKTINPETPTATTYGTARLSALDVITGNTATINLSTTAVTLPGGIRDHSADGDRAIVKIDGGLDLNNNGVVDHVTPGAVDYGFEEFTTASNPGYNNANGNGSFSQAIDATNLAEGYHFLEARAFRQRSDGGPSIYTPFTRVLYVDRLKPVSAIDSVTNGTTANDRKINVRSVDQTANNVHVFLDLPASLSEAQIIAMVGGGSQGTLLDRDLWQKQFTSLANGNHVVTIVSYEITGNRNVQRIPGLLTATSIGAGLGDVNRNGSYEANDVTKATAGMESYVYPDASGNTNTTFQAAADMNGDGLMDSRDLYLQRDRFVSINAPQAAQDAAKQAVLRRGDLNGNYASAANASDIDHLYANLGNTTWKYDLDVDGGGADQQDVDTLVQTIFQTRYGDANLDGRITFDDYVKIDLGFNNNSTGWANGDFNGSGSVNFDDYVIIDINFNEQNGTLRRAIDWISGDDRSESGRTDFGELGSTELTEVSRAATGVDTVIEHFEQFGAAYGQAFLAVVPEPATPLVTLLTFAARTRRRRGVS